MNPSTLLLLLTGGALLIAAASRGLGGKMPGLKYPVSVLAVGDSLTADGGYCTALQALLPAGSVVTCEGFPGEGAERIGKLLDPFAFSGKQDVIVLAGVNDLASGRGVQHTIDALEGIYQKARASGARVIAVHLTPWGGYPGAKKHEWETVELNAWIEKSPSVEVIVETVDLGPSGYLRPEYDSGDGLHLNAAGQARLGELIFEQVYGG